MTNEKKRFQVAIQPDASQNERVWEALVLYEYRRLVGELQAHFPSLILGLSCLERSKMFVKKSATATAVGTAMPAPPLN